MKNIGRTDGKSDWPTLTTYNDGYKNHEYKIIAMFGKHDTALDGKNKHLIQVRHPTNSVDTKTFGVHGHPNAILLVTKAIRTLEAIFAERYCPVC